MISSTAKRNLYSDIVWRNADGKLHRENGPAFEYASGNRDWYLNGHRHRENGPAVERVDGRKEWWINGQRHREDGPAVVWSDGTKIWYINGLRHRENGPAVEYLNGDKEWYCRDLRHREDGPALERTDGSVEYYLGGETGPDIEQKVKENMARIQSQKEQQELLNILSQDDEVYDKINTSSPKTPKKL